MKTILLIEDNSAIRENIIEYLEMEGYKILFASNGKDGIELAITSPPDLIICDVRMYGMSGYQVLEAILESEKTRGIPFIFSTSMSEKVDRAEALSLGADDYISKPFELETLLQLIKTCIQKDWQRKLLIDKPDNTL